MRWRLEMSSECEGCYHGNDSNPTAMRSRCHDMGRGNALAAGVGDEVILCAPVPPARHR